VLKSELPTEQTHTRSHKLRPASFGEIKSRTFQGLSSTLTTFFSNLFHHSFQYADIASTLIKSLTQTDVHYTAYSSPMTGHHFSHNGDYGLFRNLSTFKDLLR